MTKSVKELDKPALPSTIGGKRYAQFKPRQRAVVELTELDLPELTDESNFEWPAINRPSKYSKYDSIKVGQIVPGLPRANAITLQMRLRKKNIITAYATMSNGLVALKRIQ